MKRSIPFLFIALISLGSIHAHNRGSVNDIYKCDKRGNLTLGDSHIESFSGQGECSFFEDGLNSGQRYYCVAEYLYEGLEMVKVYDGYAICSSYVSDLNSEDLYRCEGSIQYKGLEKVTTFGSWTQCDYETSLMNEL